MYETMATICNVRLDEKLKAIAIMLFGDALIYYASHVKQCRTYEDAINTLFFGIIMKINARGSSPNGNLCSSPTNCTKILTTIN